jgi:hypothetical protein
MPGVPEDRLPFHRRGRFSSQAPLPFLQVGDGVQGTSVACRPGSRTRPYTTAGSSGVPEHLGARFSQPSWVTTTVSSCLIPNSPGM